MTQGPLNTALGHLEARDRKWDAHATNALAFISARNVAITKSQRQNDGKRGGGGALCINPWLGSRCPAKVLQLVLVPCIRKSGLIGTLRGGGGLTDHGQKECGP